MYTGSINNKFLKTKKKRIVRNVYDQEKRKNTLFNRS